MSCLAIGLITPKNTTGFYSIILQESTSWFNILTQEEKEIKPNYQFNPYLWRERSVKGTRIDKKQHNSKDDGD